MAGRAKFSTVHHVGLPGGGFTRVPNLLIRDPRIKPATKIVVLWFASQCEGREIRVSQVSEETGLPRKTAYRSILDALATPALSRVPTGHDSQGNETHLYTIDLTPWVTATHDRGSQRHTTVGQSDPLEKTIEKTIENSGPPARVRLAKSDRGVIIDGQAYTWSDLSADFDLLRSWLVDQLDITEAEESTGRGMWQQGRHPYEVRNTIAKRRDETSSSEAVG